MKKVIFKNIPDEGKNGVYNFPTLSDEFGIYNYTKSDSVDSNLNEKFLNRDLYSYTQSEPLNQEILDKNLINPTFKPNINSSYFRIDNLTIRNRGVHHRIRHGAVRIYLFTEDSWGTGTPIDLTYNQIMNQISPDERFKLYQQTGRKFKTKGSFGQIVDNGTILRDLADADCTGTNDGYNTLQTDWSSHIPRGTGGLPTFNPATAFAVATDQQNQNLITGEPKTLYVMVQMAGNSKRWGKVKRRRKRIEIFKLTIPKNNKGEYQFKLQQPYYAVHSIGNRTPAFAVSQLDITISLNLDLFSIDTLDGYDDLYVPNIAIQDRDDVDVPYFIDIYRNFEENFIKSLPDRQVLIDKKDYLAGYHNPYLEPDASNNIGSTAFGNNWSLKTEPEFYDFNVLPKIKLNNLNYDLQNYYSDTNDKLITSTPNKIELSIKIASNIEPTLEQESLLQGIEIDTESFTYNPIDENDVPMQTNFLGTGLTINEEEFKRIFYVISWDDKDDSIDWKYILDNAPQDLLELKTKQAENIYNFKFNMDKVYHNYTTPGLKKIKLVVASYRNIHTKIEYESDKLLPNIADYNFNLNREADNESGLPTIQDIEENLVTYFTNKFPRGNPYGIIQPIRWKLLTVNIFFNESISDFPDFGELGGADYTTIPWPYTNPIIGGISKDSKYIKSINESFLGNRLDVSEILEEQKLYNAVNNDELGQNIEIMDLEQVRFFNNSYSIHQLLNIPAETIVGDITQPLEHFWNGDINDEDGNTTPEYLSLLPFPQYYEEFNINPDAGISQIDVDGWVDKNRPDIAILLAIISEFTADVTVDITQPLEHFWNGDINDEDEDTTPEYLSSLPFPQYYEEFNINTGSNISQVDAVRWVDKNRPDIAVIITIMITPNLSLDNWSGWDYIYPNYINSWSNVNDISTGIISDDFQYTYPFYINSWSNVNDIPTGIITDLIKYNALNVDGTNYWNGETPETTFPEESSVGQIFISDNQDVDLKQNCKLELNTGELGGESIYDSSGNANKGLIIGDYKVKKQRKNKPMRRDSFIKVPKKTGNTEGAL